MTLAVEICLSGLAGHHQYRLDCPLSSSKPSAKGPKFFVYVPDPTPSMSIYETKDHRGKDHISQVFGNPIIIINYLRIALELAEKRAGLYSSWCM